jgi:hypothetical protein
MAQMRCCSIPYEGVLAVCFPEPAAIQTRKCLAKTKSLSYIELQEMQLYYKL